VLQGGGAEEPQELILVDIRGGGHAEAKLPRLRLRLEGQEIRLNFPFPRIGGTGLIELLQQTLHRRHGCGVLASGEWVKTNPRLDKIALNHTQLNETKSGFGQEPPCSPFSLSLSSCAILLGASVLDVGVTVCSACPRFWSRSHQQSASSNFMVFFVSFLFTRKVAKICKTIVY